MGRFRSALTLPRPTRAAGSGGTGPAGPGRHRHTRTLEIDLPELVEDVCTVLKRERSALAVFIDELQDLDVELISALVSAQHMANQPELPFFPDRGRPAHPARRPQLDPLLRGGALHRRHHRAPVPQGRRRRPGRPRCYTSTRASANGSRRSMSRRSTIPSTQRPLRAATRQAPAGCRAKRLAATAVPDPCVQPRAAAQLGDLVPYFLPIGERTRSTPRATIESWMSHEGLGHRLHQRRRDVPVPAVTNEEAGHHPRAVAEPGSQRFRYIRSRSRQPESTPRPPSPHAPGDGAKPGKCLMGAMSSGPPPIIASIARPPVVKKRQVSVAVSSRKMMLSQVV